jgi:hypothetical protein
MRLLSGVSSTTTSNGTMKIRESVSAFGRFNVDPNPADNRSLGCDWGNVKAMFRALADEISLS